MVAVVNLTSKNIKAEGTIFVPRKVARVRAVLVTVGRAPLGNRAAEPFHVWRALCEANECALLYLRLGQIQPEAAVGDAFIRDAAAGGADALVAMLKRFGEQSARSELSDAPLLHWGGSAGAGFGTTFAELYSARTVAFIRYHAHLRGSSPNFGVLKVIPALLIAGAKDETAGIEDAERFWKNGRSAGDCRRSPKDSGWLGNNQNTLVAPYVTFPDPKESASWLPDEITARVANCAKPRNEVRRDALINRRRPKSPVWSQRRRGIRVRLFRNLRSWVLRRLLIAVGLATMPALAAGQKVPDDFVIKLERTVCGGECPAYWVSIDARGNVTYEGAEFVRVVGRQTDRIPESRAAAVLAIAERIGFFGLRDQYRTISNPDGTETIVTDLPTAFVTITRSGQSKRVEDYFGAPQALKELEQQIDDAARTKRWIRIDTLTLQQLARDGWSPSVEEGADLLRKALQYDEVDVVKGLLDIGADPNTAYNGTNTPPLMMVRSAAAARALIEAGANPLVRNDNGWTPLGWAAYFAPDVTQTLVAAGVQVDQPTDTDGRTPLSQAAYGGNAGVVKLLLDAGANPTLGPGGTSALDCAKQGKENARRQRPSLFDHTPPFVPDFDRVIALLEQALARRKSR